MPSLHPVVRFIKHVAEHKLDKLSGGAGEVLIALLSHSNWYLTCKPGNDRIASLLQVDESTVSRSIAVLVEAGIIERRQVHGRGAHTDFILPPESENRATHAPASTLRRGSAELPTLGRQNCGPRVGKIATQRSNTEQVVLKTSSSTRVAASPEITTTTASLEERGIAPQRASAIASKWGPYPEVVKALLRAFDARPKTKRFPGLLVTMFKEDAPAMLKRIQAKKHKSDEVQKTVANEDKRKSIEQLTLAQKKAAAIAWWQKASQAKRLEICKKVHFPDVVAAKRDRFLRDEPTFDKPSVATTLIISAMLHK
jgi:predicted transcriptional regulator